MNAQADTITDILIKHLQQELSAEEQGVLDTWLASSEANVQLFERLNDKKLIASELDKLYYIDQDRENAWKRLCRKLELDISMAGIDNPSTESAPVVHRVHFLKTSWFRYAAAVVLIAGGAAIWYTQSAKSDKSGESAVQTSVVDIAPGSSKAVLTLADGSTIVLDDARNGNLVQQGSAQVVKLANGQLAYKVGDRLSREMIYNTMTTPRGGQYRLTLPDGSNVWLNAASSIKYPTAFVGTERSVEVTGEVYMEIAQNPKQPFIVKANGTEVKVLGTSFNINAYSDEDAIRTTLVEGSVRVLSAGAASRNDAGVILKPGEQAQISGHDNPVITKTTVQTEDILAWKNGYFGFNGADIKTIMRQISRWYDVEVVYQGNVPERRFLGELRRNMSLAAVLRVLERSNVHFSLEGRKLIVKP